MFTKPTVFVLGAGVSAPFGFPVGKQMQSAICHGHYFTADKKRVPTIPSNMMATVISSAMGSPNYGGIAQTFLNKFAKADLYSIDAWLEANQAQAEIMKAGKAAIAAVILVAELKAKMEGAETSEDWFAWFWNNAWTTDIKDLKENKVWFVTFNYDRLLEWKLKRQISNTYLSNTPEEHLEAYNFFLSRIVHVHGSLHLSGPSDIDSAFGYDYFSTNVQGVAAMGVHESMSFGTKVGMLAQSINVVCETAKDDEFIEAAKRMITNDSRLVFLGFSFDKRNIKKLGLDKFAKQRGDYGLHKDEERNLDDLPIIATGMGIKRGERSVIKTLFNSIIGLGSDNQDAVEFCRSYLKSL